MNKLAIASTFFHVTFFHPYLTLHGWQVIRQEPPPLLMNLINVCLTIPKIETLLMLYIQGTTQKHPTGLNLKARGTLIHPKREHVVLSNEAKKTVEVTIR